MHAAFCDHCGQLLRAAVSTDRDQIALKEQSPTLSQLNSILRPGWRIAALWPHVSWWLPVTALLMVFGLLIAIPSAPRKPLSGQSLAEFAVNIHRQHTQQGLPLDLISDSQKTLNEWFKTKLQFPLTLPASPSVPGEERPYRLEGARLVPAGGTMATYIAYQMREGPAGLIVMPDSVAVASGGVEANFKKVSFHYTMAGRYKVVTWSAHGLTYALVSEEGNDTQRSCMICHSAIRDRDLSHSPTPLHAQRYITEPALQ